MRRPRLLRSWGASGNSGVGPGGVAGQGEKTTLFTLKLKLGLSEYFQLMGFLLDHQQLFELETG